jgi:hypothetical protein
METTLEASTITERKEELYKGSRIVAYKEEWKEVEDSKGELVLVSKKRFVCHLYRPESKWQPLNLGECNDGRKFTAVNQAVNQAKELVDYHLQNSNKR